MSYLWIPHLRDLLVILKKKKLLTMALSSHLQIPLIQAGLSLLVIHSKEINLTINQSSSYIYAKL